MPFWSKHSCRGLSSLPQAGRLSMTSSKPLIAICGTTGVGKSKLAIELALKLRQEINDTSDNRHKWRGARIINADSMQVYAGMDVITNKVPLEERMGIEHLLMGFKQPGEQYIVGQWVQDAMQAIEETHTRNEIPIVVGGTSYWIQHLLFPNRLASNDLNNTPRGAPTVETMSASLQHSMTQLPPDLLGLLNALPEHPPDAGTHPNSALSLHKLLQALDEPVASRWHWKDTRKVLRSLQIIKETGRAPSEIMSEQSGSALIPRYRTLCFWLYAEPVALYPRLNERVDDMIEQGLLDEIRALQKVASSSRAANLDDAGNEGDHRSRIAEVDYTLGIYQCIGYKEFRDFLSSLELSQEAFASAVEKMKQSTRNYAKRQVTWLRNKMLPAIHNASAEIGGKVPVASMYLLDATLLGNDWTSNVLNPAESIMDSFLQEKELPDPVSLSPAAQVMLANANRSVNPSAVLRARRQVICSVCTTNPSQPVMIEEGQQWDAHCGTRLHRRLVAKAKGDSEGVPRRVRDRGTSGDESDGSDASLHFPL
ncbi:hypothetical protein HYDPIDRAFT_106259 [Hydnomerulius pinastri MD-312]|nr:hypothetical protein HYDPIDRAFT_106259 [Hydnomerulius pinastri MD-312]